MRQTAQTLVQVELEAHNDILWLRRLTAWWVSVLTAWWVSVLDAGAEFAAGSARFLQQVWRLMLVILHSHC